MELVLCILAPGGARVDALPKRGAVILGRGADCDVVIDDVSVSRRHARIRVDEATLTIEDLGSANGTAVFRSEQAAETAKVTAHRLHPGVATAFQLDERVTVGSVTVLVRLHAESPKAIGATTSKEGIMSGVVSRAAPTQRMFELADRLARGPLSLLLTGETGVGKEVLAAYVHQHSPRASGPFVAVNCAALTESLAESELFGHEKGAFTGALTTKKGFFEAAGGGTLFLDEVGELALPLQAKLLRVLEMKEVLRVGATTPIAVDVRVIVATHRDLAVDVRQGRFRQDLYFRVNGMTIHVPPLRDRQADVPELAQLFASRTAQMMGFGEAEITPDAITRLSCHTWPGNVRELRNVMDRAVALAGGSVIGVEHLVFDETAGSTRPPPVDPARAHEDLRGDLAAEAKRRILEAIASCDGNQTRAAERLGMPRRTLVARLAEYGVTKRRRRPPPA